MNVRVVSRIAINAPLKEVFRYVEDSNYHLLWNPHLQSIDAHGRLKKGTKYHTTSMLLGVKVRSDNKVTQFEPNEVIEISNQTGPLHYTVHYQFIVSEQTTMVHCTTIVDTDTKAFGFTKPVMKLLAQRELRSDLQALKIAVEQQLQ